MGFLGLVAVAALRGDIDIPIGPACSGVMAVAVSGGAFATAGWFRRPPPFERNKLLTVVVGLFSAGIATGVDTLLPNDPRAAWASIGVWFGVAAAANWLAMRRPGKQD